MVVMVNPGVGGRVLGNVEDESAVLGRCDGLGVCIKSKFTAPVFGEQNYSRAKDDCFWCCVFEVKREKGRSEGGKEK